MRDHRELPNTVPLIFVRDTNPSAYIAAGSERFSQANSLDQDIWEITDNLTFDLGAHKLTVGTHNEFFKFNNVFFPASLGVWAFGSADSLAQGLPFRYELALPGPTRPDGPVADFSVQQFGVYAQDQLEPIRILTVTAGLRVDVPFNDKPVRNPALDTIMGINTAEFPSGNALRSPRLGLNYDLDGAGHHDLPRRRRHLQRPAALRVALERVHQHRPGAGVAGLPGRRGRADLRHRRQ